MAFLWRQCALLVALFSALPAPSLGRGVTAVEKVIELLTKLDKQVTEEGAKEAAEYDKFACFCKEQADAKQYAIEKSTDKIASLGASIEKLTTEIQELDGDVITLGARVTAIEGEVDQEEGARKIEFDAYVISDANVTEAIEQVQMAIKALKASKTAMSEGTNLGGGGTTLGLQQVAKLALSSLPTDGRHAKVLTSLLEETAPGDPGQAHSYEFRSNDIISTLHWLERSFKENKKNLHDTEHQAAAASDKKVLALLNEKKFKEKSKIEKEELSAEKGVDKHSLTQDKEQEEKDMQSDTDYKTVLTTQCETKASEWDARSQSRSAEITAISEAIGLLKTGVATTYDANKKLVGLASKGAAVHRLRGSSKNSAGSVFSKSARRAAISLLQVQGEGSAQLEGIHKALAALAHSADLLRSPSLVVLGAKVKMEADHFEKVRALIKDLIAKLESEASSEAESKGFCDTEMTKAIENRDTESLNMEDESATISSKKAKKVELQQEVAVLSGEIADLKKFLAEANTLRLEEKKNNDRTVAEAAQGKLAVEQAISVLEGYYSTFTQVAVSPNSDREGNTVGDLAPATSWSGDYTGKQDASKGILGLLNVILTDFERTGSTVTGQESEAAGQFVITKQTTDDNIGVKEGAVTSKTDEVTTVEGEITTAQDALNTAEGLHASALKELEKLKAMCIEGETSYAERKKKREQEIAALRQAMTILEDWKR